jgi:hypothetical protein
MILRTFQRTLLPSSSWQKSAVRRPILDDSKLNTHRRKNFVSRNQNGRTQFGTVYSKEFRIVTYMWCDYRRDLDWCMDLLTTYTNDSELQRITPPPLILTIHKSPQHALSLFQPAVSSPAFQWQRLLTVEILQLHALGSYLHSLPYKILLSN